MYPLRFLKKLRESVLSVKIIDTEKSAFSRWYKRYESKFQFAQAIILFFTVGITLLNLFMAFKSQKTTSNFAKGISEHLTNLNEQFFKVEENLRKLPESLAVLDTTTKILGKQMIGLGENMASFKAMLQDINEVTEKQLTLIKETQKQWEEELSKKPILEVKVERKNWINEDIKDTLFVFFSIPNSGDKWAEKCWVNFYIPEKYSFIVDGWSTFDAGVLMNGFCYGPIDHIYYSSDLGYPPRFGNIKTRFKISEQGGLKLPINLPYTIYHKAGTQRGILEIKQFD